MYTITVKTNSGEKKEYSVIDKDLAIFMFKAFMKALDLDDVVMIDGLTGEVLYLYSKSEGYLVYNSTVIDPKYMS